MVQQIVNRIVRSDSDIREALNRMGGGPRLMLVWVGTINVMVNTCFSKGCRGLKYGGKPRIYYVTVVFPVFGPDKGGKRVYT